MGRGGQRGIQELIGVFGLLASGADLGAQRAKTANEPILRARWLAIAGARAEQRDRVSARIATFRKTPPVKPSWAGEPHGEVARLLRADLATSHSVAARCRRVARWMAAFGDAESANLLERIAAESLGHAAELARSLAHLYVREARTAAQ